MDMAETLLRPRAFIGDGIEYTFNEECLAITNMGQLDPARRRIEIPWRMLARFVSELQEIERVYCESATGDGSCCRKNK